MMLSRSLLGMTLIVGLTCFVSTVAAKDVAPPPNAAATAGWDAAKGELTLQYHGVEILHATVTAKDSEGKSVAVKLDSKTDDPDHCDIEPQWLKSRSLPWYMECVDKKPQGPKPDTVVGPDISPGR